MNEKDLEWEELSRKSIVTNEWIDFRESTYRYPDGRTFTPYYSYSRRDYVVIVASDEEGNYICVRQYRQGIKEVTCEFPAGGIERTDGKAYGSKSVYLTSGPAAESSMKSAAESSMKSATESSMKSAAESSMKSATASESKSAATSATNSAVYPAIDSATKSAVDSTSDSVTASAMNSVVYSGVASSADSLTDPATKSASDSETDSDAAEDSLDAAKRELREETGYVSDEWKHLISVPSSATISDNYAHVFLAKNCWKVGEQQLDETEYLEVVKLTPEEIETLIHTGKFQQAVHVMAWLLAKES